MILAGLTGGMGCGKSFVADALRDMGAHVIEADQLGRESLQAGETAALVAEEFGSDVVLSDGGIDRAKLAAKVFGDEAALARLNAIVHPAVRAEAERRIAEIAARDPKALVVYVAAILLESGAAEDMKKLGMDKLIVVTCTPEQQLSRALERAGATEDSVRARLQHQFPQAEKAAHADYVIDAGDTKESTLRQTKMVFEELRRPAV